MIFYWKLEETPCLTEPFLNGKASPPLNSHCCMVGPSLPCRVPLQFRAPPAFAGPLLRCRISWRKTCLHFFLFCHIFLCFTLCSERSNCKINLGILFSMLKHISGFLQHFDCYLHTNFIIYPYMYFYFILNKCIMRKKQCLNLKATNVNILKNEFLKYRSSSFFSKPGNHSEVESHGKFLGI